MIVYRPAVSGDAAALAELCAACLPQPWSADAFASQMDKSGFLLTAWEGDRLVGFAVSVSEGDAGYLDLIAVDPAYRRQGIAKTLLAAAEDWCRGQGLSRLLLEVRASNAAAQAFYAAQEYETLVRRRGFYDFPREDGLTMQKVIL